MGYEISVIIPCYNAEKTLQRAIDSVINQTFSFENIELLLYDDASTDKTKKIIEYYSEKYENIIPLFSNYNKGQGNGKDSCILKATGKYIMFMDSDDEYEKNMCETLFNEINGDIDVVSCNIKNIEENFSEITYYKFTKNYKSENKSLLPHDELIYIPSFEVVNKIFKRDIIIKNKIKFTDIRNGEDEIFLKHYLLYSKKLVHINNYVGYNHFLQQTSISYSHTIEDLYSYLFVCKTLREIYDNTGANIPKLLKNRIARLLNSLYFENYFKEDKNRLCEVLFKLSDLENEISFKEKLGLVNDILNFFIIHKHFRIVIAYLKIVNTLQKSKILLSIYRNIFQKSYNLFHRL